MPTLFQISIEVNSGSVGRIAEQIGQTALSHGWKSYITYARNHLPSKSQTIKIGAKPGIYWHGIMTRLFDRHCLHSTRATRKLIRQIEEIKPDIIQLHHIHGYFLNMEVLFRYLSSIDTPVVWVFHDCWAMTGHCTHFDYVGCYKWQTQCSSCIQKKTYPASYLADRSYKNHLLKKELFNSVPNMTIVPVSHWLKDIVKKSFLNKQKIQVIQNGIDLNVFVPRHEKNEIRAQYNIGQKTMLLGVASTWDTKKGLDDFLKLQKILDPDSIIVLVGLNKEQIRQLPKEIIGITRTENIKQLADLYAASDLFINPSVEETFGLTTVEAMACGTPVLVYNSTASPELVSPEVGFVLKPHDIKGIKQVVNIIKERGKKYYSHACRDRAVRLYDKNNRFEDYIQLYNNLLDKTKK